MPTDLPCEPCKFLTMHLQGTPPMILTYALYYQRVTKEIALRFSSSRILGVLLTSEEWQILSTDLRWATYEARLYV